MSPLDDRFGAMKTALGRALLDQMLSAAWENPALKTIEGIGVAFGTHTGSRRSRNEDRVAVAQVTTSGGQRFAVAIVCDGVGGSEMGDKAATFAIASFLEVLAALKEKTPIDELLIDLVKRTDEAVRVELQGRGTTTLTVLLASADGQTAAANIGDSRIFSWRPGNELAQISIDDTIENELKRLPIQDSSALDFHRLRGGLSQAIGEGGRTTNELRVNILDASRLMGGTILATDGAWKSDDLGFTLIAVHATTAADAMRRILSLSAWTGGVDNVSVIAIEDIRKFAQRSDHLQNQDFGPAITAWICDTKFVAVDSRPKQSVLRRTEDGARDTHITEPPVKREHRKGQNRRKVKPVDTPKEPRQLDLTSEAEKSERPIIERPKIEISTEEDSNKKE